MLYFDARALLFDMDGTLVDSRAQVERTWLAWCARHALDLDAIRAYTHGVRTVDTVRRVAAEYAGAVSFAADVDIDAETAWIEALDASGEAAVAPVAGAPALLERLPPACWAVVSSAPRALLEARFAQCALPLPPPHAIVSAETVRHGKPSPEPYRLAATRLGVEARDCIVFEDAPAGLESAVAAGCRVVLVGALRSRDAAVIARIDDYTRIAVASAAADGLRIGLPAADCGDA